MSMSTNPLATPLPWNLVADAYAEEIVPHFERYAADAMRIAGLRAGEAVADVACGPGTLAMLAARSGAQVRALDFSSSMVEILRQRAQAAALAMDVVQGDGQALPWADASFDVAFSMFGLMFFPDRIRGLTELKRVLRPGGRLVISSWHPAEDSPALIALFSAIAEVTGQTGGAPRPLASSADIHAEFAAAGLVDVTIHTVNYALPIPSTYSFLDAMERTLAPLVLMRHHLGDKWPPVRDQIRARVLARIGDTAFDVPMPAFLTLATTPGSSE